MLVVIFRKVNNFVSVKLKSGIFVIMFDKYICVVFIGIISAVVSVLVSSGLITLIRKIKKIIKLSFKLV